jgi:hypothetical protein
MHRPAPRVLARAFGWPARILALAGLAVMTLGLVLLPGAPRSLAQARGSSRPAGVTVRGPHMLNPATINPDTGKAKLYPYPSTVTVSQTNDLVNQTIQVSWTGFTPTPSAYLPYSASTTPYPVVVAECKGLKPTFGQCFGAGGGGVANVLGSPSNAVFTITGSDGRGVADIQIFTQIQNQQLGCSAQQACSLLVMSAQGGGQALNQQTGEFVSASCANHADDNNIQAVGTPTATATTDFNPSNLPASTFLCSWAKRIIIPLSFSSAAAAACPIQNASLSIQGSPMMLRAMAQWDIALCTQANPLTVGYVPFLPEPIAIQDVQSGQADVALTTRPAASTVSGNVRYTYAPVAVSAVSIAYWVDDQGTGLPYTHLKLDPRLVAKLLTTSYNLEDISCATDTSGAGKHLCDPGIYGKNPVDIFVDPEFTKLNPGINNPYSGNANTPADVPIVQSGHSDMTYEMTRWVAANQDAQQFLDGQPDPWGMHVNTYYLPTHQIPQLYPTDAFLAQDPSPQAARAYSPVFPLSLAVTDMLYATPPGTQDFLSQDPTDPASNYQKLPQELPEQRALFAVLDNADASAYLMPSAAILNHAGRYVQPTQQSMAAALQSMVTASNGITQQVNMGSNNPAEYPLTMVIYAMVPTTGVSKTKAATIASWLRFVAGQGQVHGSAPGQLPAGYLPLPAKLKNEALAAANAVQNQTGTPPHGTHTATPSPSPSASASPSPGGKVSATKPSSGLSLPTVGPKITLVSVRNPQAAGGLRYILPITLIAGGFAAVLGSSLMVGDTGGALGAWILRVLSRRNLRSLRNLRRKIL